MNEANHNINALGDTAMSLERLNPGSIIEIDDPVMGGRKLGRVDETGVGYFDIHGDNEVAKPIHAELNPVDLGTVESWAGKVPEEAYAEYVTAWDHLTRKNLDLLTIARALRWGLTQGQGSFVDPDLLAQMGAAETDKVLKGRQHVTASMGQTSSQ